MTKSKRRQFAARAVWLAILILQLAILVAGIAVWFPALKQVCLDTALACQQRMQLSPDQTKNLTAIGWSLDGYALYNLSTRLVQKILGVVIGILIFWRKPDDRMAWVASVYLIVGLETSVLDVLATVQPVWWLATRALALIGSASFGFFMYMFPSGTFVPRWTRYMALLWALAFAATYFFPQSGLSINQSQTIGVLFALVFFSSFLIAQVYRYRRVSNTIEREQTKWVVLAIIVGLLGFFVALAAVFIGGSDTRIMTPLYFVADFGFSALGYLMPIAIGIAILRYGLWDIDVIIRRTVTYSILTAIIGAFYFGIIVVLQQILRPLIGAESDLAIIASTLAIAALFNPLRHRVQDAIDHRFYRRKYNAQQVLAHFAQTVRDEVELEKLTGELLNVVNETMQPTSVSLWLKKEERGK